MNKKDEVRVLNATSNDCICCDKCNHMPCLCITKDIRSLCAGLTAQKTVKVKGGSWALTEKDKLKYTPSLNVDDVSYCHNRKEELREQIGKLVNGLWCDCQYCEKPLFIEFLFCPTCGKQRPPAEASK